MAALRPVFIPKIFVLCCVTSLLVACPNDDDDPPVPDASEDVTDVPDTTDVTDQPDAADVADLPDVESDPPFTQVAAIIRQNCASMLCHGAGGAGLEFQIANNEGATDGDIRQALDGVEATTGRLLVEPGAPQESELYLVLITDDITRRMPPPPLDILSPREIAIIRNWIASGADYD